MICWCSRCLVQFQSDVKGDSHVWSREALQCVELKRGIFGQSRSIDLSLVRSFNFCLETVNLPPRRRVWPFLWRFLRSFLGFQERRPPGCLLQ